MKRSLATKNLITSLLATVLLLHFMIKSPSPKIIFIPFLICSLSMVGKSIARIMNKEKMEFIFGKMFTLVFGIKEANFGLILGGIIFIFGSLAFVLAALTLKGCFDKLKIDVLGLYAGAVIAIIGIGFLLLMYKEPVNSYGLWIIIPILVTVVGIFQVIKCIRNRK